MENKNESEVKTKNITVGSIVGWIVGVVSLLTGVTTLFTKPVAGIVWLLIAVVTLPPVIKPIQKKFNFHLSKGVKIILVLILIAVAGTAMGVSSTSSSTTTSQNTASSQPSTPAQAPIIVSAAKIYSEYQSNAVAADAKYKGNLVQVSGTIYSIDKDILGNPFVQIQSGSYDLWGVQCGFSQADQSQLAQLSKGQTVTLQGTVSGKVVNVMIDGCSIVK